MKLFSTSDKFEKNYFSILLAFLPISFIAGNLIINYSEKGEELPSYEDLKSEYLFEEGELSAIVGDRLVDIQAGNSHGIRTFLVNPNIGLPQVIGRILDKTDKGDVLQ